MSKAVFILLSELKDCITAPSREMVCLEVPVPGAGAGVLQAGPCSSRPSELACPWLPVICWGLRCHLF